MDPRQLLRPLPLMVASLFVLAAAVDVAHERSTPPDELPHLLEEATMSFQPLDPVFDFRARDATDALGPRPALAADGWSSPEPQGTWIVGDGAAFEVELADGGFSAAVLECRSARGPAAVRGLGISVNGMPAGGVRVGSEWSVARFRLPRGALVSGRNRVELEVPEGDAGSASRRAVLIRRIGFFRRLQDIGAGRRLPPPVSADRARDTLVLRGSGRLEIDFEMHELVDALIVGYRFDPPQGQLEVVVEQSVEGRRGGGPSVRHLVSAVEQHNGRVRIPLHGRRGHFALSIRAELGSPPSTLVLSPVRFVNEG